MIIRVTLIVPSAARPLAPLVLPPSPQERQTAEGERREGGGFGAGQAAAKAKGKRWGGSKPGLLLKVTPDQVQAREKVTKVARITARAGRRSIASWRITRLCRQNASVGPLLPQAPGHASRRLSCDSSG